MLYGLGKVREARDKRILKGPQICHKVVNAQISNGQRTQSNDACDDLVPNTHEEVCPGHRQFLERYDFDKLTDQEIVGIIHGHQQVN